MKIIKAIIHVLGSNERAYLFFLLLLFILSGVIEVLGIASVMPFVAAVSNPDLFSTNPQFVYFKSLIGLNELKDVQIAMGLLVIFMITMTNMAALLNTWCTLFFTYKCTHNLSKRLLGDYLSQEYSFFIKHNTADLARNVYDEVDRAVGGVILPLLHVLSRVIITILIFILILIVDFSTALIVFGTLGGAYLTLYLLIRKYVASASLMAYDARQNTFRIIKEILNASKEIKLYGNETKYLSRFVVPSLQLANANTLNHFLAIAPRYLLELVAFGGGICLVLYQLIYGQNNESFIPLIALYAYAGYRVMPALQNIYANINYVIYNGPALIGLLDGMQKFSGKNATDFDKNPGETNIVLPMSFNKKIKFVDVSYKYPDTENYVLQDLNLEMKANSSIALVGATGSGKSTLADLVAGLLFPNKGKIFIDDVPLSAMNGKNWHKNIAYVPQEIFLFDDTYEKNIAMSDCSENTNPDYVKSAALSAKATDFIMSQKSGFQSIVGENGINLSGGQKQRIGIARAIYASPNLLILDEATSALDNQTEKLVIEEVISTNKKRTVLIVAHRLSTIRHCDQIIFLQEGKIISSGTYEELLSRCKGFEKLVKAGLQQSPVIG